MMKNMSATPIMQLSRSLIGCPNQLLSIPIPSLFDKLTPIIHPLVDLVCGLVVITFICNFSFSNSVHTEVTVDGVCKLDRTCCSESAEQTFKVATSGDYKQKIQTMLTTALMPCHNHTFLGK